MEIGFCVLIPTVDNSKPILFFLQNDATWAMLINALRNPVALASAQIAVICPLLKMAIGTLQNGWYPDPQQLFSVGASASGDSSNPLTILVMLLYRMSSCLMAGE